MAYTKFGEYFRILRIKEHEVLADAKEFLGCSSAFISAVECGKKTIPDSWFEKITKHYNLKEKEQLELKDIIEESKKSIHIDLVNTNSLQKSVAIQFQRSFDSIDDQTAKEIMNLLKKK